MQKKPVIFSTLGVLVASLFLNSAFAGDIEWSGVYRIEANAIKNSELGGTSTPDDAKSKNLNYGLNHLVLRPKIVAGDGITIFGQFDIFNSAAYPNSQLGQVWGSGVRDHALPSKSADDSNTISETQKAESIAVSQLYMTLNHEFGQLLVGRAPLQFGLGITHNAGRGLFDHWYDTRDLVGYKFLVGNMSFLPMIGKPSEGEINRSDDVTDYMLQFNYENPETDMEMGVFYQLRKGGDQASDGPVAPSTDPADSVLGGPGATNTSKIDSKTVNVYVLRDSEKIRLGVEASFVSGQSGVETTGGEKVNWGGFGVAFELMWRPQGSNWNWGLKAGQASGDDPGSKDKFEGFIFDRNYDVAMLMFNHPMGQSDFFRTKLVTGNVYDTGTTNINKADVEAISNVQYIAPTAKYVFSDRWSLDNTLITGFLNTEPFVNGNTSKDLGYEWDINLNFTPRKGVAWINGLGMLFPGSAWEASGNNKSDFAYGLTTKAAISF